MQFNGVNNSALQQSTVFCICTCIQIPCAPHLRHSYCALSMNLQRCEDPFPHSFHCLFSMTGACFPFLCGPSWLGCQDLPAMGEVSIYALAANSGSSWMFQAPNLHLAMQLLITVMQTKDSINIRVFLKVGESFQGGLISLHSYFIINSIITMKTRQV